MQKFETCSVNEFYNKNQRTESKWDIIKKCDFTAKAASLYCYKSRNIVANEVTF